MSQKINAVYLKSSPKSQIEQLCQSAFNTVIVTFISFDKDGQFAVDGPMADYQPNTWIDALRKAGKKVLFSIGGEAVNSASLGFLFESPQSTSLSSNGYAAFLKTLKQILNGGAITLKTLGGADYPTNYGGGFHGVDFDLENFVAYSGEASSDFWADRLSNLNLALKKDLPAGTLITHAPQTPYLLKSAGWPGATGANADALYSRMMEKSGAAVDWLNVQIYNQGNFAGQDQLNSTVSALLTAWPTATGSSANQIVITVAMGSIDCGTGYVGPDMLKKALAACATPPGGLNGWSYSSNDTVTPNWAQQFARSMGL